MIGRVRAIGATPANAGALAALAMIGLIVANPFDLVTLARERSFDQLYTALPRKPATASVIVVDIDEATLSQVGAWPLPRLCLAALIDHLRTARPQAVAFDIFFPAADRHSPRTLASELAALPGGTAAQSLIASMPDTDMRFADALRSVPSVLGALAAAADINPPPINFIKREGRSDTGLAPQIEGLQGPYPPLADAALAIGLQSLWGEDGGRVRRVPLILEAHGADVPGLALEAARIGAGAPFLEVDGTRATVRFGAHAMWIDPQGSMRIHWSDAVHWTARTVSAIDVLNDKIPAARLAHAFVLIGSSAPEVGDLRPTAVNPLTPSVQIEADALEQLLGDTAPSRPSWVDRLGIAAALVLGLAAAWLATRRGPLFAIATVAALMALWWAISIAAFLRWNALFDPVAPPLVALVAGSVGAAATFARTRRLKALISRRFEQYLAPAVVREIVAQPDRVKLDGEMREVTALFTDIEGFTVLTSKVGPKRLIALLDPYFGAVCRIVTDHGGMVDLIVGDAVHAFFNMPLDVPDHADAAVDCALAITRFADAFRRSPQVESSGFGRTRIGIETGQAIVGDVGGPARFNYTAHGRVANAAARLEAANKQFGTTICIGPGTAAAARRADLRGIGTAQLQGFPEPVEVFTPRDLR